MKKLVLSLLIVASCLSVKAQTSNPFVTTDSLLKFTNKWVRNSPIDAFSNLRLNTAMVGIIRFLQDSYGGKITGMAVVGDSLKITTTDGIFAVYLSAGGGGTNLTFTRNGTTVTVVSSNGTDAILPSATQSNAGILTAADKLRIDSSIQIQQFRDSLAIFLRVQDTAAMLANYLNSTDTVSLSNRINLRQPAGNYITDLNGDVLATGPVGGGSANAVLSNTTVIPGEYLSANITVDSKGRITAAANGSGGGSGTDNTNLGSFYRALVTSSQGIKTFEPTTTLLWDSTSNSLRARVDTSAGKIATQYMVSLKADPLGFTPENVANKSTTTALGTSNTLYPTQNAVKTYVDNIAATKQDLIGYTPENIANKSTNTALGSSNTLYPTQNAVKTYVDNQITGITFPTVDAVLADGSTNAIQNNAVYDGLQLKLNKSDTAAMLAAYINSLNTKVKYSDTSSMLSAYRTAIGLRMKYTDTAAMLLPYANKINTKQGIIALTTIGSSGAATFDGSTLNIPSYAGGGGSDNGMTGTGIRPLYQGGQNLRTLIASTGMSIDSTTNANSLTYRVDTAAIFGSLTTAINNRIRFADTTTILSSYLTAINSRVKYTDTSSMLTAYRNGLNSKQGTLSLTTTGTSGAATLVGNTINIPQYAGATYTAGTRLTLVGSQFNVDSLNLLAPYQTAINARVKYSDTATILAPYATKINTKQNNIALTTIGSSGAATFDGTTLNIPSYAGGSGGDNGMTGTAIRPLYQGTQNLRTIVASTGMLIDSTTNANSLTYRVDTATIFASLTTAINARITASSTNTLTNKTWNGVPIGTTYGGVPAGGSVGQVLAKINGTDYNIQWIPAPTGTTYFNGYGTTINGENEIDIDTTLIVTQYDLSQISAGTSNATVGSGFRPLSGSSQNLRSWFPSTGLLMDSTTNTNGLTIKPDTSFLTTINDFKTINGNAIIGAGNIVVDGVTAGDKTDITVVDANTYTIDANAITTSKIADANVTDPKIASGVNATKIGAGTVDNTELGYISTLVSNAQDQMNYAMQQIGFKQNIYNIRAYGAVGDNIADDRLAIQATILACDAGGGGIVYSPNGIYSLGTGKFTVDNNGHTVNAQLYVPVREYNGTGRTHIVFEGESKPNFTVGGLNVNFTASLKGAVWYSKVTSATGASVLGSGVGSLVAFNFNYLTVRNLAVLVKANTGGGGPAISGIDGYNTASSIYDNVVVSIDTSMVNSANPTNDVYAFRSTANGGESWSRISNTYAMGFTNGYVVQEHCVLDHAQAFACYSAIGTNHSAYAISIYKFLAAWCKRGISFYGGDQRVQCSLFEFEKRDGTGKWFDYEDVVYDPNNYGHGKFVYTMRLADTDLQIDSAFTMNGGSNLNVVSLDDDGRTNANNLQGVTDVGNTTTNGISAAYFQTAPEGAYQGLTQYAPGNIDGYAIDRFYPSSGTNVGTNLTLIPKGTGYVAGGIKSAYNLFATDFVANQTNYSALTNYVTGTKIAFNSVNGGSSPLQTMAFEMNSVAALTIDTDGGISIPYMAAGDSDDSVVVRKPNGTFAKVAQSSLGGGGGSQSLQQVTDIGSITDNVIEAAGFKITPETTGETAVLYNPGIDNLALTYIYPTTGTNVGNGLSLIPRGTGYDASNKTLLNLYGTDYIADASNFNALRLITGGSGHIINSMSMGTGTVQPLSLTINSVPALTVGTDRKVTIPIMATGSSGDSVVVRTAAGELKTVAQASISGGGGGSDSWTVTGSDIYRNSKVRIGSTSAPSDILDVTQNANARARIMITNTDAGTSAQATFGASNGTSLFQMGILGVNQPGFLTVPGASAYMYSDATAGMAMVAENGQLLLTSGMTDLALTSANGVRLNGTGKYFNFGSTAGSGGYGFRDNSGTIQWKNSGGSWADIATGGGGGGFTSPLTTVGDLLSYNGSAHTRIAAGTFGYVLTSNGTSAQPSWQPLTSTSGTYTPTVTNVSNVAAYTAFECSYTRVGDVVHVQGYIELDPTSSSVATEVTISLPLSNNFATLAEGSGSGGAVLSSGLVEPAVLRAEPTSDQMSIRIYPSTTVVRGVNFVYTYILNSD